MKVDSRASITESYGAEWWKIGIRAVNADGEWDSLSGRVFKNRRFTAPTEAHFLSYA